MTPDLGIQGPTIWMLELWETTIALSQTIGFVGAQGS